MGREAKSRRNRAAQRLEATVHQRIREQHSDLVHLLLATMNRPEFEERLKQLAGESPTPLELADAAERVLAEACGVERIEEFQVIPTPIPGREGVRLALWPRPELLRATRELLQRRAASREGA